MCTSKRRKGEAASCALSPRPLKKYLRLPVPEFAVWGWSRALSALTAKLYQSMWKQQDALED